MSIGLMTRGILRDVKYLDGPPPPLVFPAVTSVAVAHRAVTLTLSYPVTPASADLWVITGPGGVVVEQVEWSDGVITLHTSEMKLGAQYVLTVPDVMHISGLRQWSFTGVGQPPRILSVQAEDRTHVLVTYSEPLPEAEMLKLTHYSISPALYIAGIQKVSAQQVRLTTARQYDGVLYTLTVSGVTDLAGNPLQMSMKLS